MSTIGGWAIAVFARVLSRHRERVAAALRNHGCNVEIAIPQPLRDAAPGYILDCPAVGVSRQAGAKAGS